MICYTLWGFLPLLFNAAEHSGAGVFEIVAWRTIWAAPLAIALVCVIMDRGAGWSALFTAPRASSRRLFLSAGLIAINWSVYVWAVDNGRTLSASLGYYLNPLLNMAAGALLFRERIDRTGMDRHRARRRRRSDPGRGAWRASVDTADPGVQLLRLRDGKETRGRFGPDRTSGRVCLVLAVPGVCLRRLARSAADKGCSDEPSRRRRY